MRINDKGGFEFAIRRIEDQHYLADPNLDGSDPRWEDDADNATWLDTPEAVYELADRFDLMDPDADHDPVAGVEFVKREWVNEEDIDEDYRNPEPTVYHE